MYVRTREGHILTGGSTMPGRPKASNKGLGLGSPVDSPVLDLIQIQRGNSSRPFTRKPTDFEAFFSDDFPSPQAEIAITGKLIMEKNGVRRAITAADLKKLQPEKIHNYVYPERGVSIGTNPVRKLKFDGSFTTESYLIVDSGTRRIRVRVILELKGGNTVTAEAIAQCNSLDCFLALMDSYESRRPIGRVTGTCYIAGGHFDFLWSIRKMFQPAAGSPLAPMFDLVLHRNRKICQLADGNSAEGRHICSLGILNIDKYDVDIGHVLVGIEAHRRQKPNSQLPTPLSSQNTRTEAFMTWAGDLGSALEPYAEAKVAVRMANIQSYLAAKASVADLLGDVDGINMGSVYDERRSLAENLRDYYGTKPFRRFRNYLTRLRDDTGNQLSSLTQQRSLKISSASRATTAGLLGQFVNGVALKRKVYDKLAPSQQSQFSSTLYLGSKEMNIVIGYFFAFLEAGLAKDP